MPRREPLPPAIASILVFVTCHADGLVRDLERVAKRATELRDFTPEEFSHLVEEDLLSSARMAGHEALDLVQQCAVLEFALELLREPEKGGQDGAA